MANCDGDHRRHKPLFPVSHDAEDVGIFMTAPQTSTEPITSSIPTGKGARGRIAPHTNYTAAIFDGAMAAGKICHSRTFSSSPRSQAHATTRIERVEDERGRPQLLAALKTVDGWRTTGGLAIDARETKMANLHVAAATAFEFNFGDTPGTTVSVLLTLGMRDISSASPLPIAASPSGTRETKIFTGSSFFLDATTVELDACTFLAAPAGASGGGLHDHRRRLSVYRSKRARAREETADPGGHPHGAFGYYTAAVATTPAAQGARTDFPSAEVVTITLYIPEGLQTDSDPARFQDHNFFLLTLSDSMVFRSLRTSMSVSVGVMGSCSPQVIDCISHN
jgi:hypothetical protein